MTRIERSIAINVPPERIWPMVFWDRSPEWLGLIKEAKCTSERRDTVSACYHLLGKAAGRKFEFDVEFTDLVKNEECSWRTISGNFTGFGTCIHASGTTTLTPIEGGTKMTIIMNYNLPYSILGWIIDKLVVGREMKKGLKKGQEKLKSILEE